MVVLFEGTLLGRFIETGCFVLQYIHRMTVSSLCHMPCTLLTIAASALSREREYFSGGRMIVHRRVVLKPMPQLRYVAQVRIVDLLRSHQPADVCLLAAYPM